MAADINQTLLLSETEVKKVFEENGLAVGIKLVEEALAQRADHKIVLPDKISQIFNESTQSRINCMPASILKDNYSGIKWVSVFPQNPLEGLPNVTAKIILSELKHGFAKAVMGASYITGLRTAAVGAVAAKYLAPHNARSIGFIGAGNEARAHLDLVKMVVPSLRRCYVSSRRDVTVTSFIREEREKHPGMEFIPCGSDYRLAVDHADIIVTATSAQQDLLKADWVRENALYIHVGGWEDEYAVALRANKIVCDEWDCVKHRKQTIARMYHEGMLTDNDIYADLAEIVLGQKKERERDDEFIYFCSVGLAYIDIMFAKYVYEKSLEKGLGSYFSFG